MNMRGYLSLDEMIAITEKKIKGTVYELLGTEKFLQKALDNAHIRPIYRFTGYLVTQCRVDTDFWTTHDNIQNIWWIDGYFQDNLNPNIDYYFSKHRRRFISQSAFRNLGNSKFILSHNSGKIFNLVRKEYLGNYDVKLINRINSEGEVYLTGWYARLFNEKPIYEGSFGHEDLKDTIIIDRDRIYISIEELSKVLELDPSAYELSPDTSNIADSDNNIIKSITQLEEEIKNLKAELEEANKVIRNQSYLDPASKFFSIEMKLCHDTWNYLYKDGIKPRLPHSKEVRRYLESYPDFEVNTKAITRIATITNPKAVLAKSEPDKQD